MIHIPFNVTEVFFSRYLEYRIKDKNVYLFGAVDNGNDLLYDRENLDKVKHKLKNMFPSITFIFTPDTPSMEVSSKFYFEEESDEAYFKLISDVRMKI